MKLPKITYDEVLRSWKEIDESGVQVPETANLLFKLRTLTAAQTRADVARADKIERISAAIAATAGMKPEAQCTAVCTRLGISRATYKRYRPLCLT